MSGDSVPWQASDEGGTPPPSRVKNSWKERNRDTIVTIVGTDVNRTAVNNDEPTQPNRGRVAVSFRIGGGNKGPNNKCGAIFKRLSPSCQTNMSSRTKATQARKKNKTKRKTSARPMARQQPWQKAIAEQQRKATRGMSKRQLAEGYRAVCESLYKQRSANYVRNHALLLIEKDMRNTTTSSRGRRGRSDSDNTRKQRPSNRIHCLRDECKRRGVDKYSGACEPFNVYEGTKLCVRTRHPVQ